MSSDHRLFSSPSGQRIHSVWLLEPTDFGKSYACNTVTYAETTVNFVQPVGAVLMNFTTTEKRRKKKTFVIMTLFIIWCFVDHITAMSSFSLSLFGSFLVSLLANLPINGIAYITRMQPTCWLLGQTNRSFEPI